MSESVNFEFDEVYEIYPGELVSAVRPRKRPVDVK